MKLYACHKAIGATPYMGGALNLRDEALNQISTRTKILKKKENEALKDVKV